MEIGPLIESFEFRFAAAGVDNAKRVAEELLAHVFHCKPLEIYTGAVPRQTADTDKTELIKQLEPHDRVYYTGFLGPLSSAGEIDLFVNLRCMKLTPNYISLYVGGGITLESDAAEEWNETRLKALSLLKIMGSYIKNLEIWKKP